MLLNIHPESETPLYIQIYQQIKDKIHKNELKTNEKIASKRQLASQNDVSENTVMNAYNQLLTEGYLYSLERKGYFVADVELHDELPEIMHETLEAKDMEDPTIAYDFTRSNPDEALFPFSVFSKLHRSLFNHPSDVLLKETSGQGLLPLRVALQHYLSQSRGVPCRTDQIILGPSTEYLLSVLLQILEDKPVVGIENPGYHGFNSLFRRLNLSVETIPLDDKGADVEALAQSDVDLMIVTSNHQFPTGSIMPLQRRQALIQWANEESNRYVIENDYDSEFKYAGVPIPSLKYLDQKNKVIHLGSFTRVLSPGIRLSYMVLPDSLLAQYRKRFPTHSSVLSTSEQWLMTDFITEGHFTTHLNRSRTFYKKKRDVFIQAIQQLDPEATIHGENAGLHLLVSPSFHYDGLRFEELALAEGIRLGLLSDYFVEENLEFSNVLFLSFSKIPEGEIEKVMKKCYFLLKKCAL